MKTIFEKIIDREIPAKIIHETGLLLAFHDIAPQAPVHALVIPKKHIARLAEAGDGDQLLLGALLLGAQEVARKLNLLESGFRLVINNGVDGGEAVPHLHIHVLGGRHMEWPPG